MIIQPKRLTVAALLLAGAAALAGCQRETGPDPLELTGKMFIFNYRLANALASGQAVAPNAQFFTSNDSIAVLVRKICTNCGMPPDTAQLVANWASLISRLALAIGTLATGIAMLSTDSADGAGMFILSAGTTGAMLVGDRHTLFGLSVENLRPVDRQVIEAALAASKVSGQYAQAVEEHLPAEFTNTMLSYLNGPGQWTDPADQQAYADGLMESFQSHPKASPEDRNRLRELAHNVIDAHLDLWVSIGKADADAAKTELEAQIEAASPGLLAVDPEPVNAAERTPPVLNRELSE